MSLDVKILSLNQKVSFEDGSVSNIADVALPDGSVVVALVTEEGAQKILIALQASRNVFRERPAAPPQPAAQPAPAVLVAPPLAPRVAVAPRPAAAPPPSFEFGGGDDPIDEEEDEPVVPPQFGPTLTRVKKPAEDEAGNPVDATGRPLYENAPPPPEEAQVDEDGVRGL